MLYLEDYLEMIEHLPQELKDRFTEIRELDLQVQNATDKLEDRVKLFFAGAKKQKTPERETEFDAIRGEYYKVLEDADEKVHQANQMYELVEKYLRKLDSELYKFKMELEADNAGITEVLEKRSLEMDVQHAPDRDRLSGDYLSQKENRYMNNVKTEKKSERKNSLEKMALLQGAHSSGTPPPLAYALNHMGAGGNSLAAAASQAIAATQQMQQGRRTASLKASYDAVNLGIHPAEFSVGRELLTNNELHQAAQQALAATGCGGAEQKRNKRKSHHTQNQELMSQPPDELVDDTLVMDTTEPQDWTAFVDPSEPRYCICNEVSYGDMVACDNADCPIEWFHYGCVGITATPKGKWYCPQCAASMKRRGRR
ncbi:inhibitor of growth protein 3 isoform X1 [Folsomia candida]|uniref:inhibitor of growth protein 3 isoform X1 n=1 Tax=Folsomia candida TaxID=158441 RepID=UPI000B8FF100|nr:inhibitor of growth protein 3 isoform X1 [Folsomia candida]